MDSVKKNFYLAPDLKKVRTKQAHIAYEAKPQVIRLLKNDLKKTNGIFTVFTQPLKNDRGIRGNKKKI